MEELASRVFRCLGESPQPKENFIFKFDFENVIDEPTIHAKENF